jgi:AcrR family transcriptional regulator
LKGLVAAARGAPDRAALVMLEGLGAGQAALREREQLMGQIARICEPSGRGRWTTALPPAALIGGAMRFLSMGLLDGTLPDDCEAKLLAWARSYEPRADQSPLAPFAGRGALGDVKLRSIQPHLLCRSGSKRQRILRAAALTVDNKGYRDATIGDIVSAAGVSRTSFYACFADKREAVIAAFEDSFERLLTVCAPAYLSAESWTERVWNSCLAFTSFFAREPYLGRLVFVDCFALDRQFTSHVHRRQLAFGLFLEEGFRQSRSGRQLPHEYAALTACALCELASQPARHNAIHQLRATQPLAVYVAVTPFTGAEAAESFISPRVRGAHNIGARQKSSEQSVQPQR